MKGCAVLSQAAVLGWGCGGKVSCAMGPGEHSQGVTLAAGVPRSTKLGAQLCPGRTLASLQQSFLAWHFAVRRDTPPQQPLVPLWHPLSLSPKLCLVGTPLNGWGLQGGA